MRNYMRIGRAWLAVSSAAAAVVCRRPQVPLHLIGGRADNAFPSQLLLERASASWPHPDCRRPTARPATNTDVRALSSATCERLPGTPSASAERRPSHSLMTAVQQARLLAP